MNCVSRHFGSYPNLYLGVTMRVSSRFVRSLYLLAVTSLAACSSGGDSPPAAPTVSTSSLSQAEVNVPLNQSLGATGTGPFSWQISNGTLPTGITLQSSGVLTGTPNANQEGQYPFTVRVTGPGGSATKDLKLAIIGSTHRVSVVSSTSTTDPLGGANGPSGDHPRSFDPAISNTGRFVVFDSAASNLVPGINPGGVRQVYLHDRQTGLTEMISVTPGGVPGNNDSFVASVSDDGNVVAFDSFASNLSPGDTNGFRDVFIRNRSAGTTVRISQFLAGGDPLCTPSGVNDCNSFDPSMSADGSVIAFGSFRRFANDTDDEADIYVYTASGSPTLTRISVPVSAPSTGSTGSPSVSADGRFVAFASSRDHLIAGDTDGISDIFRYDRQTASLRKANVVAADGNSFGPSISGDGRFVAFWSEATNLLPPDSNGAPDIFIADMQDNPASIKMLVNGLTQQFDGESRAPSMSRDGKIVAFDSLATNIDAANPDTNGVRDVYVVDRSCSTTFGVPPVAPCTFKRGSVASNGDAPNGESRFPALSGNGNYVAYFSDADNLVPLAGGDGNGVRDAFVTKR